MKKRVVFVLLLLASLALFVLGACNFTTPDTAEKPSDQPGIDTPGDPTDPGDEEPTPPSANMNI